VDHSTAGAVLAYSALGGRPGSAPVADAVAAVVAGHHAGLADIVGGLDQRIQAKAELLQRALAGSPPPALLQASKPASPACVRPTTGQPSARRGTRPALWGGLRERCWKARFSRKLVAEVSPPPTRRRAG
jgi:hypothetical protein